MKIDSSVADKLRQYRTSILAYDTANNKDYLALDNTKDEEIK